MMFGKGRELTAPHNSGKCFGELNVQQLRQLITGLTAEEQASPFSRYYYEPMAPLQSGHMEALQNGPMKPTDGFMPEEFGKVMLNTGHAAIENGYCVLPNGLGFAAAKVDQPGRTNEKVKAFREEFAHVGDLFYKTWYPGSHLLHYVNGAIEDFGWGMLDMQFFGDCTLKNLGIDKDEIEKRDPSCISINGATTIATRLDNPEAGPEYASMALYLRETPAGRELRVRYWVGLLFTKDGIECKTKPDGIPVEDKARMMMGHCMKEYTNENRLLDAWWEDRNKE